MANPPNRGTYVSAVYDHTDASSIMYGIFGALEWDQAGRSVGHQYVRSCVGFVVLNKRVPNRPKLEDIDRIDRTIVLQLRNHADNHSLRRPPHFEDRLDVLCNLMSED